jgi:hypothetical protein
MLRNPRFAAATWFTAILAVNAAATSVAALYVLAQNAVNLRVIATESPDERAVRLWKDHPVLELARRQIPEDEGLLYVAGAGAPFRGLIAYALYPRRFEPLQVDRLPPHAQLERTARAEGLRWIVVDGQSRLESGEEDRVWKFSE